MLCDNDDVLVACCVICDIYRCCLIVNSISKKKEIYLLYFQFFTANRVMLSCVCWKLEELQVGWLWNHLVWFN